MITNTKTYSCESLHHALYLAPDMLRHCCKCFFVNVQMSGYVKVYFVHSDVDIDVARFFIEKMVPFDSIHRGLET